MVFKLAALSGILALACQSSESGPDPNATPVLPTNGALAVRASEWKFEPSAIEISEGEEIAITFENDGEIVHNLKIDDIDAEVVESAEDGEVFVEAEAGESAELVFTPGRSGEFTYYCNVPDHRELGMEGRLLISAE